MVQNQKEITELWKKLFEVASEHDTPITFAALAVMLSEIEYHQKEHPIVFDSFLAFSRHVCGEMEAEDRERN